MTAIAPRPQTVTEVSPASDSWQASWSAWRYPDEERASSRHPQPRARGGSAEFQSGCTNLRTLLAGESLAEVWESMLGHTSSQEHVIDSWAQLLRLN